MAGERQAIETALELSRMPTLARSMRRQRLPEETLLLIRIAAGCEESLQHAAELARVAPAQLKEAAVFFLQQVLFAPDSGPHRVLGLESDAPRAKRREHLKWLMRWLHPDQNPSEWETAFAGRVLDAWRLAGQEPASLPVAPTEARMERSRWHQRGRDFGQSRVRWVRLEPKVKPRSSRRRAMGITVLILAAILGSFGWMTLAGSPLSWPLPLLSSGWAPEVEAGELRLAE